LAIVACFTPERSLLGIRELAGMLDMSPATTHRYVSALETQGYLEQDRATRKYRLTFSAIDLGMAALSATGLCMHGHPYLESLARRTRYTVALAVLDGPEVLVVAALPGARRDQRESACHVRAGSRLPAYCTSLGKVLLANLPAGQRLKLISAMEPHKGGPRTIMSESALRDQLEDVRQEGLAINDEELLKSSCAIAAPVRDESGDVVAAVSVVVCNGAIELEELENGFAGQLTATANRISTRLGWQGVGE
jgi:IclR family pca regulon transcriptional regulator